MSYYKVNSHILDTALWVMSCDSSFEVDSDGTLVVEVRLL